MRLLPLLVVCTALVIASCDDDTATTPTDSDPTHRDIPASLRAKCPDMTAARSSDGTTGALTIEPNETQHVNYSVYDSTGTLVSKGETDIPAAQTDKQSFIRFTGKDASGKALPTGHYFVFLEVRDQAGALVQSSSYCIGWNSGT